jgi:hypothetical protein
MTGTEANMYSDLALEATRTYASGRSTNEVIRQLLVWLPRSLY